MHNRTQRYQKYSEEEGGRMDTWKGKEKEREAGWIWLTHNYKSSSKNITVQWCMNLGAARKTQNKSKISETNLNSLYFNFNTELKTFYCYTKDLQSCFTRTNENLMLLEALSTSSSATDNSLFNSSTLPRKRFTSASYCSALRTACANSVDLSWSTFFSFPWECLKSESSCIKHNLCSNKLKCHHFYSDTCITKQDVEIFPWKPYLPEYKMRSF